MRNNAATLQLEETAVILQCGPGLGTIRVPMRREPLPILQMTSPASLSQLMQLGDCESPDNDPSRCLLCMQSLFVPQGACN